MTRSSENVHLNSFKKRKDVILLKKEKKKKSGSVSSSSRSLQAFPPFLLQNSRISGGAIPNTDSSF